MKIFKTKLTIFQRVQISIKIKIAEKQTIVTFRSKLKLALTRTNFEMYLLNINVTFNENTFIEKEFKNAFFPSKTNGTPGYEDVHVIAIRHL